MIFSQEKKFTKIIPEESQILELIPKDIKLTVLNMFNELKATMDKERLKEIRKLMSEQNKNVYKEKL